jgi:hypothetical protein
MFSVVLCGCENWSLTMTEEHMLRRFKDSVLRDMLGENKKL